MWRFWGIPQKHSPNIGRTKENSRFKRHKIKSARDFDKKNA